MDYPRIVIAAAHSGAGKTTLVLGLILRLRQQGLKVQAFKTGPDYIDPGYHAWASGRPSYNLDSWMIPRPSLLELFARHAQPADISVIEGVMGLYDGIQDSEQGSTAHLAKLLACPVVLILDARSISRSAGAIVLGFKNFDKKVNISGVILNRVGSENHYRYIKNSIERKTGVPVLGKMPQDADLVLPERHLGLISSQEGPRRAAFYRKLSDLVEKNIDIKALTRIAKQASKLGPVKRSFFKSRSLKKPVLIAVARDRAFNFYYQDNLEILEEMGARLIEFSPLVDKRLPKDCDGVYIGGGFPEMFAEGLAKNVSLRRDISTQGRKGLPILAECGGLMYLVERLIDFQGKIFPMVGLFKGSVRMAKKRQALGYAELEARKDNLISKKGQRCRVHIFHWSYLEGPPADKEFVFKLSRPGSSRKEYFYDGLSAANALGAYAHFHFAANINFAKNFIDSCYRYSLNA